MVSTIEIIFKEMSINKARSNNKIKHIIINATIVINNPIDDTFLTEYNTNPINTNGNNTKNGVTLLLFIFIIFIVLLEK